MKRIFIIMLVTMFGLFGSMEQTVFADGDTDQPAPAEEQAEEETEQQAEKTTDGQNSEPDVAEETQEEDVFAVKSSLQATVSATDSVEFTYTITDEKVTITGYTGSDTEVTIPSEIDGYPVVIIGENAFNGFTGLTSITIPLGITNIRANAFLGCDNVTDVYFGGNKEEWNQVSKEYGNDILFNLDIFHFTNLEWLNFTYTLTEDGARITGYTGSDTEITIPSEIDGRPVTRIGDAAFENYSELVSVAIPKTVNVIEDRAFYNCSSLTSITIPESVISIGDQTFTDCSSLTEAVILAPVEGLGNQAFMNCTELVSVTLPENLTRIDDYAFNGCSSLAGIEIPDNVTYIGNRTFYECTSLESVEIPDTVTTVDYYTFYGCSSLSSIKLSANMRKIGYEQFRNCTSLTSIEIPDSVTEIDKGAFQNCKNLESINIPDNVTSIATNAFNGCSSLRSIVIPDSVTSLGNSAFSNCSNLSDVVLSGNITRIGNSLFNNCTSLTSVRIPGSATMISFNAFTNCSNLESITIPVSVTSIGENAFASCTKLTDVYYTGIASDWEKIETGNGNDPLLNADIHFQAVQGISARLVLQGSILVQFKMVVPDPEHTDVVINYKGEDIRFPATDGEVETLKDGTVVHIYNVPVAAKEMHEPIVINFEDEEGKRLELYKGSTLEPEGIEYSVEDYVESQQDDATQELDDLLDAMMLYGEWAQKQFDHNADTVTPEPVEGVDTSKLVEYQLWREGTYPAGIEVSSSTLILKSETTVVFKLKVTEGEIGNYTVKIDGKKVTLTEENGMWLAKKENIVAKALDDMVEIEISKEGDSNVFKARYGPLTYVYNQLNKSDDDTLKNLCKALYNYNDKANIYFAKTESGE